MFFFASSVSFLLKMDNNFHVLLVKKRSSDLFVMALRSNVFAKAANSLEVESLPVLPFYP
jgi:hypothetical protein